MLVNSEAPYPALMRLRFRSLATYSNTPTLDTHRNNYVETFDLQKVALEELASHFGYHAVFECAHQSHNSGPNQKCDPSDMVEVPNQHFAYAMTEVESLQELLPQLQGDGHDLSHYHLITWRDDFLLRADDPERIKKTLPGGTVIELYEETTFLKNKNGNSIIFDHGGHLGGYAQDAFQQYLLGKLGRLGIVFFSNEL